MKVLVVHASRFGSTREIAEHIAARLGVAGLETVVAPATTADPTHFDAVVLGSGIYAGHWAPAAIELVRRHRAVLAQRPLWLFSSGPIGTNSGYKPTEPAEAAAARRELHPRDHRTFWGSWDSDRAKGVELGRMERFAAQHLLPEGDFRDWPAIDAWTDGIARALLAG